MPTKLSKKLEKVPKKVWSFLGLVLAVCLIALIAVFAGGDKGPTGGSNNPVLQEYLRELAICSPNDERQCSTVRFKDNSRRCSWKAQAPIGCFPRNMTDPRV